MADTSAMPVLEIMRQRFTSGNSIPVHSARITADEWDTIRAIIEKHQQPSVSALEAENERLEEELEDVLNLLGRLYRGNKELLRHGTWDKVKAILSREQEKQP